MPTLPEGTRYGTLTWQVIRAVGDTAQDPDRDPDATVIAGLTAVFTPTVSVMKDATVPVTIFANPITATFDDSGFMVGEDGQQGVRLIATDSPNLQPQGVQYKVVLSAPTISSQTLTVEVWADQTTDLTTAVVPSAGSRTRLATVIPTNDPALLPPSTQDGDLVLAQDTSQLYQYTDATLTPIANLRGEKGDTGDKGDKGDTGDVTPEAQQALADSIAARDAAQGYATALNTWFLRGNGSPVGVVTPSSAGVQYVDLAATNGARIWVSTGTTSSAWRVVDGDTGWRDIRSFLINGWTSQVLRIRRVNGVSYLDFRMLDPTSKTATNFVSPIPTGFHQTSFNYYVPISSAGQSVSVRYYERDFMLSATTVIGDQFGGMCISWPARLDWPTTLPGTPT